MINLDELEKKAREATQEKWYMGPNGVNFKARVYEECNGHVFSFEQVIASSLIRLRAQQSPSAGWDAIHLKTGNVYRVIGEAINATNAQNGQTMVIYQRGGKTYVREAEEFMSKFAAAPSPEGEKE